MSDFFIKAKGDEKGPFTESQVRSMWSNGVITSDTVYRTSEGQAWQPVAGMFETGKAATASNTPPMTDLSRSETPPVAIWSLVLGILSLAGGVFITGIPALICGRRAQVQIRASGGALKGEGLATAGIITGTIGIGLFVVGLVVGLAIPAALKGHKQAGADTCIINLRRIDGATAQWALEHHKNYTETPTWAEVAPYLTYLKEPIKCPQGGVYSLGNGVESPTCSIPGHRLP